MAVTDEPDHTALALTGGALADRLAWVFVSGYQAAVRRCFPELGPEPGWTCLAAAEAGEGPGCRLENRDGGSVLSGEKSWIAGAGMLDSLVVTLEQGGCFVFLDARATGVRITLPRTPGFLKEMTQGVATFEAVTVSDDRILRAGERWLTFRGAEPLYVLLSLNACLRTRALAVDQPLLVELTDEAIGYGRTLTDVLAVKSAILPGLAHLRALTKRALAAADPVLEQNPSLMASWQNDRRLFAMFGVASEENGQ